MAKHEKTLRIIEEAYAILAEYSPMSLRQVYYQLVSRQVVKNNRSSYQALSKALACARKEGVIPWEWMEDRLRRPRRVSMFRDLARFAEVAKRSYRRDVWSTQHQYVECWLEKDALSGVFEDVLRDYGVTLNVGRGYDGWDSIYNAAGRYLEWDSVTVLYFGDFDPSGEDMVRSLKQRLSELDCYPEIVKCALTLEDVRRYNLPPDFTKSTDSRQAAFVRKYGDISVELDALPVNLLRTRITKEVKARMDMTALEKVKSMENEDQSRLVEALSQVS